MDRPNLEEFAKRLISAMDLPTDAARVKALQGMGFSQSTARNILSGRSFPRAENLAIIARKLGVSMDHLMWG